jgi:hypothetical protein
VKIQTTSLPKLARGYLRTEVIPNISAVCQGADVGQFEQTLVGCYERQVQDLCSGCEHAVGRVLIEGKLPGGESDFVCKGRLFGPPAFVIHFAMSSRDLIFLLWCNVSTSHVLIGESHSSFFSFVNSRRVRRPKRFGSRNNQRQMWVSIRSFNRAGPPSRFDHLLETRCLQ